MKRSLKKTALLLCISLLLTSLAAPLSFAAQSIELPVVTLLSVPDIITWDDVNAIPVAKANMTEDQLRQICVDYMLLQQNFTWTPTHDLDYLCDSAGDADEDGMLHCKEGEIYAGFPYGHGGLTLYNAMDYYDTESGLWDAYATQSGTTLPLTNNCGTAVMWALARVSTQTQNFAGTVTMTKQNGYLPVGTYSYDENISRFDESDKTQTKEIAKANGKQTMFKSYALLKKGDGTVTYNTPYGGHARMAIENAVVVKNTGTTTINGDKSYVIMAEQYSTRYQRTSQGQTINQHGQIYKKYTFSELYNSGYLPFTITEFSDPQSVEQAAVRLSNAGSNLSYTTLSGCVVYSNYYLSKLTITVTGLDGSVKYQNKVNVNITSTSLRNKDSRYYALSALIPSKMKTPGHVKIEAIVGSGETLTVYEGNACYTASGSFYTSHSYNQPSTTKPTCTEPGFTTHTCTRCGDSYTDNEVAALGHNWGEASYKWSEDYTACTATRICKRDETHVDSETADATTDTQGAEITYTANFKGTDFKTQTKTVNSFIWGDANGDGSVNNKDIVCLKNYLAYYDAEGQTSVHEGVTYSLKSGADANGDGMKNNTDVVRLKRYLMFFDELTGKSMDGENEVVLGPAS